MPLACMRSHTLKTYNCFMHTVAETKIFQCYETVIWSEAEYSAFVGWIAENPLAGDVIPGSGGCRKVR